MELDVFLEDCVILWREPSEETTASLLLSPLGEFFYVEVANSTKEVIYIEEACEADSVMLMTMFWEYTTRAGKQYIEQRYSN